MNQKIKERMKKKTGEALSSERTRIIRKQNQLRQRSRHNNVGQLELSKGIVCHNR